MSLVDYPRRGSRLSPTTGIAAQKIKLSAYYNPEETLAAAPSLFSVSDFPVLLPQIISTTAKTMIITLTEAIIVNGVINSARKEARNIKTRNAKWRITSRELKILPKKAFSLSLWIKVFKAISIGEARIPKIRQYANAQNFIRVAFKKKNRRRACASRKGQGKY